VQRVCSVQGGASCGPRTWKACVAGFDGTRTVRRLQPVAFRWHHTPSGAGWLLTVTCCQGVTTPSCLHVYRADPPAGHRKLHYDYIAVLQCAAKVHALAKFHGTRSHALHFVSSMIGSPRPRANVTVGIHRPANTANGTGLKGHAPASAHLVALA